MMNEQIVKNIEAAIKFNKETRQNVNEALSQAMNAIKNIDKKFKEEYERGCKDAWDLACDICCSTAFGGLSVEQLRMVFGKENAVDIMDEYSYEKAKKKMDEFLAKKEEGIDKPGPIIKGDIVNCINRDNDCKFYEGIYLDKDSTDYYIFVKEDKSIHILMDDIWRLTKTGKHIDLDW